MAFGAVRQLIQGSLARCSGLLAALGLTLVLSAIVAPANAESADSGTFRTFLERELWPEAEARGIRRDVFVAAFADVSPDPQVLALTRKQPEYTRPVGRYLGSRIEAGMIAGGRRRLATWSDTLARVEREYGVKSSVLVSILGVESNYGAVNDNRDVIRSLATLALARYRGDFFRNELLCALAILQSGDVSRRQFVGSWAGAMGQPQFLPSSFIDYAVDFSRDGRRDIWTSTPDVLASIANYLRKKGWKPGLSWGFEVVLPGGFDFSVSRASFRAWADSGLRRADGGAFPEDDNAASEAYLLFPSGARGPAFLATENFVAIKQYNNSDVYALAVLLLSDRLVGGGPVRQQWPDDDHPLSREQRIELQRELAAAGYKVNEFEGHIDFDLRDAIRSVQLAAGSIPDGNPTLDLLKTLRGAQRSQRSN
ncbi:lytic murein transglycosylase [Bradyrhizobium sp. YR681]|uniref:lytic murein transglycosylase n=1 Tax=Bradyrhizobium sp. YR681 TaxID=1144344 RepID=UPI000270EEDC|nr:lytic murein transglycosylase [Bradyrhizobium sp. YR681]EJN13186.1 lytic murein transglycosylase [Bradyrhizobium sp. YR681]